MQIAILLSDAHRSLHPEAGEPLLSQLRDDVVSSSEKRLEAFEALALAASEAVKECEDQADGIIAALKNLVQHQKETDEKPPTDTVH